MILYIYKVTREKPDGTQGKRVKQYYCYKPELKIGGLYANLGVGYPGMQRVLSMTTKEFPD